MEFSNLTDEQIEWLESKVKEAYVEGWNDCDTSIGGNLYSNTVSEFDNSVAKNQTCHILAERYMKPSKVSFDVDGLRMEEIETSEESRLLD
ncbi:hypothetical protein S14_190 [Shewanella sp. phage 1/4]|uniref:hypothetical protein n=1 Tax=Shewanella phage 1/4 TaxID=1458859 RepID=UPI0004F75290|nr:hypothetical protein S14_190 [Shewanella sp. phage 1/4]AHK11299.1 hypothetical protein S14_190 [Shewanella sp. phage 1/4]